MANPAADDLHVRVIDTKAKNNTVIGFYVLRLSDVLGREKLEVRVLLWQPSVLMSLTEPRVRRSRFSRCRWREVTLAQLSLWLPTSGTWSPHDENGDQ